MTSHAVINTELASELRKSGLKWQDVAAKCNSTVYLVRRALSAAGTPMYKRYKTTGRYDSKLLTPKQLAKVRRIKAAGATWKELGRMMGIDCGKLERYVKRH